MSYRPTLTIDPAIHFGAVCLEDTRITAENVAGRVFAGDSVDSVAEDFGVTREGVLLCCWWRVETARWSLRRTTYERRVLERWGTWAYEARGVLAGWSDAALSDPPEAS